MARIRTIKPEFWTSEQVVSCSMPARLLFIGLWNFCDDNGVHPTSPLRIRMQIFPADTDMTAERIQSLCGELCEAGLLTEYKVAGKNYYQVTGWHHQRIEKPNNRYPLPIGRQSVDDQSENGCPRMGIGNGVGMEGKGDIGSTNSDDQKCELTEQEIATVRRRAAEVCKRIDKAPSTKQDTSLVLKASILSLRVPFSEAWLYGAAEGVKLSKAKKRRPYAYLHECLREGAAKVDRDFKTELAKTLIPDELNHPPPNAEKFSRLCAASKEPPA